MAGTRALILDLRDTAGPGSRNETRGILAHFARPDVPWQLVETRSKPRQPAYINLERPGPAYPSPIAVLVNRWTAGEGESLAAGIAALSGARLVGTPMAGLRGELYQLHLTSGLVVGFPGRRTFTPDGTPRENLRPDVPVDLAAPSGGPGDPILYQALKLFERR
jgi:carboxyl-terminal processing protease